MRYFIRRAKRAALRVYGDLRYPLPSRLSNFQYNKALWDKYASGWTSETWRPNRLVRETEGSIPLTHLGEEWGINDVQEVMECCIFPNLTKESVVAEIGSGGGRLASRVVARVRELWCFDVSSQMLNRCRSALADHANVKYVLLEEPRLTPDCAETFDFVYTFDVFVHLDLHMMWKYFREIARTLKGGGKALIHTAALTTPAGWQRFESQTEFRPEGFYFVCPQIVQVLAEHANLKVLRETRLSSFNSYNRDYLVLLQK
jgi:SAM-dependent methyltransferase